jgi:predicted small integral membrane protein
LQDQLTRWTEAGLIDAGQAGRIDAAEHERLAAAPHRRLPLVAEVLGYAGAAIALTAAGITVQQFWKHVPPSAELAFAAVAAIGLLVAGAAVHAGAEPAFARLRSVLWLLATAGATVFVGVLSHRYLHLSDNTVGLLAAAAWLACAIPLWWRTKSPLQHTAVFGGVIALAETGLDRIDPHVGAFGFGLALWVVAGLWAIAVYRDYLPPRHSGVGLSAAGLLVGGLISMDAAAGQVLAVLTVAGLLTVGIITRRVLVIVVGAIGVTYVVPDTASRYLPGSVGAPLAVAVVGLILFGIALWLARTRSGRRQPPTPA